MTAGRAALGLQRLEDITYGRRPMQDLKCGECGQTFKSPRELQDHNERTHGVGKKGGEPIVGYPPSEPRR